MTKYMKQKVEVKVHLIMDLECPEVNSLTLMFKKANMLLCFQNCNEEIYLLMTLAIGVKISEIESIRRYHYNIRNY